MKHRREIDGLRALAVLPVILFHAGISVFSGGYVGVDVFFVISGYLITSILISELEQDRFSISRFYERRARRILPALFVVVVACIPPAWLWMTPSLFKDFNQSIIAVIFFASNILFWKEDGYFAEAAEFKPLLHTWSLAVEEQYYLLFPLFLMLLPRFGRQRLFWAVAGIALASLLLSEWGWRNAPSANFYLAPFRVWELLAGSICAFLTAGRTARASNLLSIIGLAMIIFAIFAYDRATPFPSLYALVPVGGTILIILFASQDTWGARILSTAPMVTIGMISYSAYLWHQPLFAFARIKSAGEPNHTLMVFLAMISLVLAAITWRYVEQPFRNRNNPLLPSRRAVFLASGVGGGLFSMIAVLLMKTPTRLETIYPNLFAPFEIAQAQATDCPGFAPIAVGTAKCSVFGTGDKLAVIWGDSHAEVLARVLQPPEGYSIIVLHHRSCPPSANIRRLGRMGFSFNCRSTDALNRYLDYIVNLGPEAVFLVARWTLYMHGWYRQGELQPDTHWVSDNHDGDGNSQTSTSALRRGLQSTIERLSEMSEVFVVSQPVDLNFMGAHERLMKNSVTLADTKVWHAIEEQLLSRLEIETKAQVLPTKSLFCGEEGCALQKDGRPLYEDDNHLSPLGARMQWDMIVETLDGSG